MTGTGNGLQTLHQCGKNVKIKIRKGFGGYH